MLPDSVTKIEAGTFWDCSSLTSITLPDSLTRIERNTSQVLLAHVHHAARVADNDWGRGLSRVHLAHVHLAARLADGDWEKGL